MRLTPSEFWRQLTIVAMVALLSITANCSGDRAYRPQTQIGSDQSRHVADTSSREASPNEERIIGLAEEMERNAMTNAPN